MILIALVILLVVLAIFPTIRCALFHPLLMVWNIGRDVWFYFRHKEYNRCSSGELIAFCGLFGKGKTLSAVHKVVRAYHRYDGKPVWCPRRKKMVAQRIKVISNVSLDIPYEDFQSLEQVVLAAEKNREYDDEHDTAAHDLQAVGGLHCNTPPQAAARGLPRNCVTAPSRRCERPLAGSHEKLPRAPWPSF